MWIRSTCCHCTFKFVCVLLYSFLILKCNDPSNPFLSCAIPPLDLHEVLLPSVINTVSSNFIFLHSVSVLIFRPRLDSLIFWSKALLLSLLPYLAAFFFFFHTITFLHLVKDLPLKIQLGCHFISKTVHNSYSFV